MNLNGREVKFRYSVGASLELKKRYAGKTAESLEAEYTDNTDAAIDDVIEMLIVLNKAAVMKENFDSGKPVSEFKFDDVLTRDEILNLTEEEFTALVAEMYAAKNGDSETTVEVHEKKTVTDAADESN